MYVVSYDISDDKERLRVSRVLDGYGKRLQRSVYQCWLDASMFSSMKRQLDELALTSGYLLIWRVPDANKPASIGILPEGFSAEPTRIFVI